MSQASEQSITAKERAERELRRGNFKAAIEIYRGLSKENPNDGFVTDRLKDLEDLLQPMELDSRKADPDIATTETTGVHEAETAANMGNIPRAIEIYAVLIQETPDNELFKERLEELRRLAEDPVMRAAMPRSRPPGARAPTGEISVSEAIKSSRSITALDLIPVQASNESTDSNSDMNLPKEPVALLQELLKRVLSNKR